MENICAYIVINIVHISINFVILGLLDYTELYLMTKTKMQIHLFCSFMDEYFHNHQRDHLRNVSILDTTFNVMISIWYKSCLKMHVPWLLVVDQAFGGNDSA